MTPSAPPRRVQPHRRAQPLLVLLAFLIVAALGLAGCGGSSSGKSSPASSASASDSVSKPAGMSTVAEASLPAEARDVIRRIDDGGTFQYRQDGVTFQNREGRLPPKPGGYYREYTVSTPGAADRGARRLILGRQGELYYTPDHYGSFLWVVRGGAT